MAVLVYSKANHEKSYWEMEIGGNSWPANKAPLKLRLTVPGRGNGIGVRKITIIDAVTGKIKKIKKETYRFIWHF